MKNLLEIRGDKLYFNDEPFYIASGDMHYFRFFRGGWERRLKLMKDFGLNCVQTYVPWIWDLRCFSALLPICVRSRT